MSQPKLFPPGTCENLYVSDAVTLYPPESLEQASEHPHPNLFIEEQPKFFLPGACKNLYLDDTAPPPPLYPPESLTQAETNPKPIVEEPVKLFPPEPFHEDHNIHKMKVSHVEKMHTFLHPSAHTVNTGQLTAMANRSWFYGNEIASIYGFPSPDTTRNVTVGVISFGGGLYGNVAPNGLLTNGDVQAYWTRCGISTQNQPKVFVVPLFGAQNTVADSGTDENTLDVEMIGCACPSPKLTIILYLVPNSLSNFNTIFQYATTTPVSGNSIPTILSVSWAASEIYNYGSLESTLKSAADKGINIFVASGDNGSTDSSGNASTCNYPSSSPNVIACGGTNLMCPTLKYNDSSTKETTWSGSGGGISKVYAKPSYQSSLSGRFRQIPDISLDADPSTGIAVLLNGGYVVYGGTSFVAPLMAGFLATINVSTFINPLLYSAPRTCFNDIVSGSNGTYSAKVGYDDCTGLGSINGTTLSQWLVPTPTQTPPPPPPPIVHVSSVSVSPTSLTLQIRQTSQLNVTILPTNASNNAVTWASSNPSICSVSSTGLVTSLSSGSSVITVTSVDGSISASSIVTVPVQTISVSSVTISPSTITLSVNQTYQVNPTIVPSNATNKAVVWSSSNTSIATISSSGILTARSGGTSTITVTTADGSKKATLAVTVPVNVSSVSISASAIKLSVNQTYQVSPVIMPSNATNKSVTWSSSNTNITTVSSSGLVTARSSGTATITVTTVDGSKTATLAVTVSVSSVNVASVTISPSIVTLSVNDTYQVIPSIDPPNASNKMVTWKSSNANVAVVSSSGLVRALSNGTTVINATTLDGLKMASLTINVPAAKVTVSKFVMPRSITSLNTNAGRMGHMKVSDQDIDHTLVVKSCMKYKNE